jgi:hypothetical protein
MSRQRDLPPILPARLTSTGSYPKPPGSALLVREGRRAYQQTVCQRQPPAPQNCRGPHRVAPTGGVTGTGIGRTEGVGIGGTLGGGGPAVTQSFGPVHTGTCRHTPLVQSNRHIQLASATADSVTSSSKTKRMWRRRNFLRPVVTSQRTLPWEGEASRVRIQSR